MKQNNELAKVIKPELREQSSRIKMMNRMERRQEKCGNAAAAVIALLYRLLKDGLRV